MKKLFGGLFQGLFANEWWIEISTGSPRCTYYFGPFTSESEAAAEKPGYIEDLEQEGAQQITSIVKRCGRPDMLTVEDDGPEGRGGLPSPAFSSQI
ncbi:MAG: DUF1816 domain-containing protein [Cyanobacteria bacterium P01_A01_bin.123]